MKKKIGLMVIDDSAVVRQSVKKILEGDPDIEIIGVAQDPIIAIQKLKKGLPDVILLDIEMPRMDGLTFLKNQMESHPLPIIICSSMAEKGTANCMRALEYGAVNIIEKPKVGTKAFLEESRILFHDAILAAHLSRPKGLPRSSPIKIVPKLTADAVIQKPSVNPPIETTDKIVVVGASTGGTEALRIFLESLPSDAPGIVIVQHMPEKFTAAFAQRLDQTCRVTVKEAESGDTILKGRALIAPGNRHTLIKRSGAVYHVEVRGGPLVCRHRPSVDVLFRSAARYCGRNAMGVILTGMGDDGARGMAELKETGAFNIAQNEASCVVFGMPKEAIKRDAVDLVLPLEEIAHTIIKKARG